MRVAVLQALPPQFGSDSLRILALRRLQFVQRGLQAVGNLRQLPAQQAGHLGRIARLRRRVAKHLQGLQQVLHIMRHPGAGFVDRPGIAHPLQLLALALDQIELDGQAQQPLDVPAQGRRR